MQNEELERKLKRERVEICLNCQNFVECDRIGLVEVDHCESFLEIEDSKQVVVVDLEEYANSRNAESKVT